MFDRRDFWLPEVEAVCLSHGIEALTVESTFPGTHAVFCVNGVIFLKLFCPVRYNSCQVELETHRILAANALVPSVQFSGQSPHGYDYIAFSLAPGRPLRELGTSSLTTRAVRQLADWVAGIQAATLNRDEDTPTCLVHYDLTRDHIFLNENGDVSAIIDFGDAVRAHPAAEFPVLFIDAFDCEDGLIRIFSQRYNALSDHYRIAFADIALELRKHPFAGDILRIMSNYRSNFVDQMTHYLET